MTIIVMVVVSQFKCLYLWALHRFKQQANCKSVVSDNRISVILFMFVGSSAYGVIILRELVGVLDCDIGA